MTCVVSTMSSTCNLQVTPYLGPRHRGPDTGVQTLVPRHWGPDTGAQTLGPRQKLVSCHKLCMCKLKLDSCLGPPWSSCLGSHCWQFFFLFLYGITLLTMADSNFENDAHGLQICTNTLLRFIRNLINRFERNIWSDNVVWEFAFNLAN